jgi:hypothetical protein
MSVNKLPNALMGLTAKGGLSEPIETEPALLDYGLRYIDLGLAHSGRGMQQRFGSIQK